MQLSSTEEREHLQVFLRIRPFTSAESDTGESQVTNTNKCIHNKKKRLYRYKSTYKTFFFTVFNRAVLPLSLLTQFCWSLPVCPSQRGLAPTNLSHRLDSAFSSLRSVISGFPIRAKKLYLLWPQKAWSSFLRPDICLLYFNKELLFYCIQYYQLLRPSLMSFSCTLNRCTVLRQHRENSFKAQWRIWWKMFWKGGTLWFSLTESPTLERLSHS